MRVREWWVILALLLAGCRPAGHTLDLLEWAPKARHGVIVSGSGPLGGEDYKPFLGPNWSTPDDTWIVADQAAKIGFFLYETRPIRLTLRGKSASSKSIEFALNGRSLLSKDLSPNPKILDLELDSGWLKPGLNWLEFEQPQGTSWSHLIVEPRYPAILSGNGQVAKAGYDQSHLLLPFGQPLALPLPPHSGGRLSFESELWVEPGIAPLGPKQVQLLVTIQGDEPQKKVIEAEPEGAQELNLGARSDSSALTLEAVYLGKGGPKVGQLGLKLRQPKLIAASLSSASPQVPEDVKLRGRPPALYHFGTDPEQTKNLILLYPATTLYLESLLPQAERIRPKDSDLRSLQYLH